MAICLVASDGSDMEYPSMNGIVSRGVGWQCGKVFRGGHREVEEGEEEVRINCSSSTERSALHDWVCCVGDAVEHQALAAAAGADVEFAPCLGGVEARAVCLRNVLQRRRRYRTALPSRTRPGGSWRRARGRMKEGGASSSTCLPPQL